MSSRISDTEMARRTEELVLQRIEADDLILPALPQVVSRCLTILGEPDFSVNQVARLMESDPLIAARIVRVSNSAARATLEPSRSVLQSVMRLGADELRTFLIEVSARPIFESHDRQIGALGHTLWAHSVAVGLLARAVVRHSGGPQPEAAYLAGLLHDVGKPVMAAMLLDAERRLFGVHTRTWLVPATWLALIRTVHRRVGVALARAWHLPEIVQKSVAQDGDYDTDEPGNLANAVRFANALAKSAGIHAGEFDVPETEALVFVGRQLFSFSDRDVALLLDGLSTRVDERLS